MTLPRAVQAQANAAKEHFDSLQNPDPAPEKEEKQPDAPDAAPQSADTPAEPEDKKHSQGDDKPTDEPKRSDGYWEHRFNVINGKYAKEVPALQEQVRKLTQDLDAANRQITELKAAPTQSSNPGGLTDEQIQKGKDEFGEDFVSFVQQMIDAKAGRSTDDSRVQQLESELNQIKERETQKTRASFWTALTELVPDVREVNEDPKFHAFLAEYDSQTGKQRQQTLTEAQQALDADGVAAVFNAFKNQQPQPQQQRIPDDQVDPPTSRATTTPEGGRIWTGAEIKEFYTKKAAGKYSVEEGKRLEADIFAAQREGRVR